MTIFLERLGDPIWQALALVLVLVELLLLMVVRMHDARLSAAQSGDID